MMKLKKLNLKKTKKKKVKLTIPVSKPINFIIEEK